MKAMFIRLESALSMVGLSAASPRLARGIHSRTGVSSQIVQRTPVGVRSAESVCEYGTSFLSSL